MDDPKVKCSFMNFVKLELTSEKMISVSLFVSQTEGIKLCTYVRCVLRRTKRFSELLVY